MTVPLEKAVARFNDRLLESACRMNRMASDGLGAEMEDAMRDMGRILKADIVALSTVFHGEIKCETEFRYPDAGPLPPIEELLSSNLSFILKKIDEGDSLILNHLPQCLPQNAAAKRKFVESTGLQSILLFPARMGDTVTHLLAIFFIRKAFSVPASIASWLQLSADFIASAHCRLQSVLEQEKLTRFEAFLGEISSNYINIPVGEIDRTVTRDLERLCRLLDADVYNILILEENIKDYPDKFFSYTAGPEKHPDQHQYEAADAWIMEHGGHEVFRYVNEHCMRGHHLALSDIEELPDREKLLKEAYRRLGVKSLLAVPIAVNREVIGHMVILMIRKRCEWPEALIRKIRHFGDLFANAYVRKRSEGAYLQAHEEIKRLKYRLESDYRYLRDEFKNTVRGEIFEGSSQVMKRVMGQVMQVAPTQTPVLLLGETGSGKGMMALALHQASRRGDRPLVQLNCAALAPGLIESELFGHDRGAFTGADRQRAGRFEIAEGATLLLDEIGELPLELQAKLLRVLETGEFERLGGSRTLKTDARIVAATNRNLEEEVAAGRFRKDLWYRLNIFPIRIPPLRERIEDIPTIVEGFVTRFSQHSGKCFDPISQGVMDALKGYPWPGNVRELRNLIERAVIVSTGGELCITVPNLASDLECPTLPNEIRPFAEMERAYLLYALESAGWRIEGTGGAAELLALNPSTLRSRMRKHGIRKVASKYE